MTFHSFRLLAVFSTCFFTAGCNDSDVNVSSADAISLADGVPVTDVCRDTLQKRLVETGAVLMYFRDVAPGDPHYAAVQYFGLRGLLTDWYADPDEPIDAETAAGWMEAVDAEADYEAGVTTRGEFLDALYEAVRHV